MYFLIFHIIDCYKNPNGKDIILNNEKLDSILNLSLETEEAVREKSNILSNGFNPENGLWEVIVKYHGDISRMASEVESLELLLNGYAIMTLSEAQLARIITEDEIEYVEKPKSFAFDVYQAKLRSCILPVTTGETGLTGEDVLIAVLDSGIDYLLPDFQNENGSRILYLWDQTLQADSERGFLPPDGFAKGVEFTKADIDRAIAASQEETSGRRIVNYSAAREIVPSTDASGHGTAVTGIATGSPAALRYQGIAPQSGLLIVKLGGNRTVAGREAGIGVTDNSGTEVEPSTQNFPLTTDLMRGISYVLRKAQELRRPVAVNMSIGDSYGSHDGTSLLERFIDAACETGRNVICIGSGNEAVAGGHTSLRLIREERIELSIAPTERSINVQIWKNYADSITLTLEAPGGARYPVVLERTGKQTWIIGDTRVLIYVSPPTPYSVNEEIFFDFIPLERYVDSGIWTFVLTPVGENREDTHFFLPDAVARNAQTRFLRPNPHLTMTIPGFSSRAITVGAYDTVIDAYADFSGRDREIDERESAFFASNVKPDIVAPGVGITAPASGGGYRSFTGTSFATPIVTGSAALLLEWGIVRGNDIFLYGEKVKAYLRRGARPLSDERIYPNAKTGYGALCVNESIP